MDRKEEHKPKEKTNTCTDYQRWLHHKENIRRVMRDVNKHIYGNTPDYTKKMISKICYINCRIGKHTHSYMEHHQPRIKFYEKYKMETDSIPTRTVTDSVPTRTETDSVPMPRPTATDIRPNMDIFMPGLKSYTAVIKWSETKFPDYNTYDARLQTFKSWHRAKPDLEQLSAAGFIYTGTF
jgi:hypothetical protein